MKVKRGWLYKESDTFYLMEGKEMIPFKGSFDEAINWANGEKPSINKKKSKSKKT